METILTVFYKSKQLQMLTAGPNYIMIRRAIFGKAHGYGVKEIWLISQFPAKHTGVASGARIVFARPGLGRLLEFAHGSYKQFIIYIACSPQSDCISLFRDPSVTFWPLRIRIDVRDVILMARSVYKQSCEKHRHFSIYVPNISGYREKKRRSLKYQNIMSFQISPCENYCESKRMKSHSDGKGGFLTVPVC